MTIRSLDAFVKSLPDWKILEGCFGLTWIAPTDIDGAVERCGTVLFLEHKGIGAPVKVGQHRLFQTLARQGNTVIVYWTGESLEDVVSIRTYHSEDLDPGTWDENLDGLRAAVSNWYRKADSPVGAR